MTICSKLIVFRIHFNEAREVKSRVHWQSAKLVKWKFHRNSLECYFTQCDTPKKNEGSERNWLTDVRRSVKNTDKSNLDSDRMLTYRVELWFLGKLGNPNSYGNSLGSIRYRHYHRVSFDVGFSVKPPLHSESRPFGVRTRDAEALTLLTLVTYSRFLSKSLKNVKCGVLLLQRMHP